MKTRRYFYAFVLTCMLMLGISSAAMAYSEQPLDTDDTWVSGNISTEGEVDFYHISIPGDGKLTVTFQGFSIYDAYFKVISEDMDYEYCSANVCYSSDSDPKTKTFVMPMSAGSYYVKIYGYGSNVGSYRVKASFSAYNNKEKEPNNGFESSMTLSFGKKLTGALTLDDPADFYRFELTSKQTVIMNYTSYLYDSYVELWDKDYVSVERKNVCYASESNPMTYKTEYKLDPGVYYIKVTPYSTSNFDNYGRYSLKVSKKVLVKSISISGNKCTIPGKTFTLKATVEPSNASDPSISWQSADSYIASVDANTGKVTTNHIGKVKITASSNDGSNKSKTITVYVKPKKETINSIYAYDNHEVYLSYDSQYNATGYQIKRSTTKDFEEGTTKTYKTSDSYKYIKSHKKGKKYYYKVRAYYKASSKVTKYGAWSSVKSIKAK